MYTINIYVYISNSSHDKVSTTYRLSILNVQHTNNK